jgi:crossover junction endodeoxyribonuclease RuvC
MEVPVTVGIDPGSRVTGYGILDRHGREIDYIDSGIIAVRGAKTRPQRLLEIKNGLDAILEKHHPDVMAVEEIFMAKNPKSTLALGEVRGVVLLTAAQNNIPLFEYSAREVKGSVTGVGSAHKSQVAAMIGRLVDLGREPRTEDETDALAVAFCHLLKTAGPLGRI